jgi:hypothetical protein
MPQVLLFRGLFTIKMVPTFAQYEVTKYEVFGKEGPVGMKGYWGGGS